MPKRSKPVQWTDERVAHLLALASEPENAIILRGKQNRDQNTSGETKKVVFERIAAQLLPDHDVTEAGKKVRSKYDSLTSTYQKKCSLLRRTGGGIGADSLSDTGNPEDCDSTTDQGLQKIELKHYIKPTGPDADTPKETVNLWQKITQEFKWFPEMHAILCTRPNQVPIALTTGVGPSGAQTVLHQPPSRQSSPDWDFGNAVAGSSSKHPDYDSDSSFIIFPPEELPRSPTPPGKGKAVHPGERGQPKAKKEVAETTSTSAKSDKKTGPHASKNAIELQRSMTQSSKGSNLSTKRKMKDRDEFWVFQEEYNTRRSKIQSHSAYMEEMRLLLTLKREIGLSLEEFLRREHSLKIEYGKIGPHEPLRIPCTLTSTPTPKRHIHHPVESDVIYIESSPTPPPFELSPLGRHKDEGVKPLLDQVVAPTSTHEMLSLVSNASDTSPDVEMLDSDMPVAGPSTL